MFGVTMGYTPGLVGLDHSVVEIAVYSGGFIIIMMFPWCSPPCGIVRFVLLAYMSCIILLMTLKSVFHSVVGSVLTVNLANILSIVFGLHVIMVVYPHGLVYI